MVMEKTVSLVNSNFNLFNLKNLFIVQMTILFLSFFSGSYIVFSLAFVLLTIFGVICLFKNEKDIKENKIEKPTAFLWFNFILNIAVVAIIIKNLNLGNISNAVLPMVLATFCIFSLLLFAYFIVKLNFLPLNFNKQSFLQSLPIVIICLLLAILSIDCFFGFPVYDTLEYYKALNTIDINNLNNINAVKLCYHISHIYTLCVYFLYCLIGNMFYAGITFNIICNILLALIVFNISKKQTNSLWFATIAAAIMGFAPFTFGLNAYIYLDTAMMYGVFFFLAAYLTKKEELIVLASFFAIFSKDLGVLITGVLVFVPILYKLIKSIKQKCFKPELKNQLNVYNIAIFLIHLAFVIFFLLKNWSNAGAYLYFGFSATHIADNLGTLFTTNFGWISIVLSIISAVIILINNKKNGISTKEKFKNNTILQALLVAFVLSMLFNFFIITWQNYRYHLIEALCLHLISLMLLFKAIKCVNKKRVFTTFKVCGILCLGLFFCQNYFTLDPFFNFSNSKVYTGINNNYIHSIYLVDKQADTRLGDWTYYNKQMLYYQIGLNKTLEHIDSNKHKVYLSTASARSFDTATINMYEQEFIKGKISFADIKSVSDLKNIETNGKSFYFINYDNKADFSAEAISSENITVENTFSVSTIGWKFTVYLLKTE